MIIRFRPTASLRNMAARSRRHGSPATGVRDRGRGRGLSTDRRSLVMKWETPRAIDFRFGMEITMYIANR